ncbi:aromatic amino acid transporter [Tatumella sp. OPLPL6]|uniref:aromatic amino acid transporter n=1 Tax=Tatumella sp. OPLPL6 TaxID=1928657 RepID=UPI000C5959EA|nr:aromatic amino acid transporter [Tatumella sp. OPLPL6]PIJ45549.1 tryptophan permease [Tatumella sp. OPLPL6]
MAPSNNASSPSSAWGAMIICGTVAGAGMFTLPVVMAGAWYSWSVLMLVISWFCMLLSGLLFMKVSLNFPLGAGYDTLTQALTPKWWGRINGLSIIFVLGILTYAYISASGPVYQQSLNTLGLGLNGAEAKGLLTAVVALVVWLGTKGVSRLITLCLVAKLLLFFMLFGGLVHHVDLSQLLTPQDSLPHPEAYWPFLLAVVPFCLASFGFHGNITGLISYYQGNERKVKRALIGGTLFALVIYLFWLTCTMGNIPRQNFPEISRQGGDIHALIQAMHDRIPQKSLGLLLDVFSHFAVICSFLGVTVGLFDFVADKLGFTDSKTGRAKTALITFCPPLIASILFPQGFLLAIGYAGLLATLWALFTPALLAWNAHSRFAQGESRRLRHQAAITLVVVFGLLNIVAWVGSQLHLIPLF